MTDLSIRPATEHTLGPTPMHFAGTHGRNRPTSWIWLQERHPNAPHGPNDTADVLLHPPTGKGTSLDDAFHLTRQGRLIIHDQEGILCAQLAP
jgi:hypothetical protein